MANPHAPNVSVPNAYRSIDKPPTGDTDHNIVVLVPIHKCLLNSSSRVYVSNENTTARLQGCFDCINWDVFRNSCCSLDEHTDLNCCISFYVDSVTLMKK